VLSRRAVRRIVVVTAVVLIGVGVGVSIAARSTSASGRSSATSVASSTTTSALATSTTTTVPPTTTTTVPPLPKVVDCLGESPQFKPATLLVTCADGSVNLSAITWLSWTSSVATGDGNLNINGCNPDCASGGWTTVRTEVVLSQPSDTALGLHFTQMTVTALTGPSGAPSPPITLPG
jgi:hypothetical protein